jgi:hypothetical protein
MPIKAMSECGARKKEKRRALAVSEFLTPQAVSARYAGAVTVGTLRNWRSLKRGPPFVHVGRRVMYRVSDLIAWETVHTVNDERA